MNRVALLGNAHEEQQISLQLSKIEYILQNKIRKYKEFKTNGAMSRFES